MAKSSRRKRKLVQVVSAAFVEKQAQSDNIVNHYRNKMDTWYLTTFLSGSKMSRIQLDNVALILRRSPIENMGKETLRQILELLCSNVDELLRDESKLKMFNVFLSREFGLPIPVEFAIGVLFQHPSVVKKELSKNVEAEINTCRQLCENLLRCRMMLFVGSTSAK